MYAVRGGPQVDSVSFDSKGKERREMKWKHDGSEARFVTWMVLFLGIVLCGCSQRPEVAPPGTFTFFDTDVTGYTKVKKSGGGYEFSMTTRVASIDAIRKEIQENADPTWSTKGWSAGEGSPQDDVDLISYTKGSSKLTISIQVYKQERGQKRYLIGYTYVPSMPETQQ
jgi:hypothetical protein